MLLIDDSQAQAGKLHGGLNECVGPNQNVHLARCHPLQNRLAGCAFDRTGQQLHPHGHGSEELPQALQVLLGQDLRGRHDGRLVSIVDGDERRQQRHHCLSTAHIPLQQPVHVPTGVHVGTDLSQHAFLCVRQGERQLVVVESVEGFADVLEAHAREVFCQRFFVLNQRQLKQKQLLEAQPILGLFRLDGVRRTMDALEGVLPRQQMHGLAHV